MADETQKTEERGFKVEDRRRFAGDAGQAEEAKPEQEPAQETAKAAPSKSPEPIYPEINFSTFLISLSTQALLHLGEIPDPLNGKVETDLESAKQMIDVLGVLREKTKGNLDDNEEKLFNDILFDLRMKYVEAVKKT